MNSSLKKRLSGKLHPTYDVTRSYEWNYRKGPFFRGPYPPPRLVLSEISFLNFKIRSRLGMAAGPLLNSRWIRTYSRLGFDLLTYKTVRTRSRKSNSMPNCLFVDTRGQLTDDRLNESLQPAGRPPEHIDEISITNSFGVPSRNPAVWQEDVQKAKGYLDKGQVLIVSTMGSSEYYPEGSAFIQDFARSAALAREAGADMVELDLSCPNSSAAEGVVYSDPALSGAISKAARKELGSVPLLIKLGNFWNRDLFESVIKANASYVDGIVGINTVKMTVLDPNGRPALPGRPQSGVCGAGIKQSGLQFARWLSDIRKRNRYDFVVIGVGGIMKVDDIREFLNIGLDAVEVATAGMWDPYLAYRYYLSERDA